MKFFGFDPKYIRGHPHGLRWTLRSILTQKIFGIGNRNADFPVSPYCHVITPEAIEFDPSDLHNFQVFGTYYLARPNGGNIKIGKGTWIGPGVGLITQNHDLYNLDKVKAPKPIIIGEKCWIGMNSVIMPGVILGNHTVVGALSIVTHSFPEGNCLIAGNPARKIRDLVDLDYEKN